MPSRSASSQCGRGSKSSGSSSGRLRSAPRTPSGFSRLKRRLNIYCVLGEEDLISTAFLANLASPGVLAVNVTPLPPPQGLPFESAPALLGGEAEPAQEV